jgi:hypothetical protein
VSASSSALALAASLRALSDGALTALLHARPVREHGIRDVFDLAEALLDAASIQAALAHLDRTTLGVLASAVLAPAAPDATTVAQRLARPPAEVDAAVPPESADATAGAVHTVATAPRTANDRTID